MITKTGEHTTGNPCARCSAPAIAEFNSEPLCRDHMAIAAEESERQYHQKEAAKAEEDLFKQSLDQI